MTIGKKGFQPKSNPRPKCPKRKNGTVLTPSMKSLARKWRKNTNNLQSKYKTTGKLTTYNQYIAEMRKIQN